MLSQADRTKDVDALTYWKAYIKKEFDKPGDVYLGLVHRLDRPASGLMIFARTSKAADRLSRLFREREVKKEYLAIIEKEVTGGQTLIDHLIKENERVRIAEASEKDARFAELSFTPLKSWGGLTLLSVQLKTGRPHQIRVQLASRGMHIMGDFRYGASRELDGKNLALHSYRLRLTHPVRKMEMNWTCPVPESWPGELSPQDEK
ncbi:MAG: RluA family pseudouridine synthase [Rhodothermia bacterium]|nr:MAG: RluA family pseudouridine synthase [Rhodothermia bacterium]